MTTVAIRRREKIEMMKQQGVVSSWCDFSRTPTIDRH